jgi:Domain of unknown function (DUF4281)
MQTVPLQSTCIVRISLKKSNYFQTFFQCTHLLRIAFVCLELLTIANSASCCRYCLPLLVCRLLLLLQQEVSVAAAWSHFIAQDLFVGRWVYLDSRKNSVFAGHSLALCYLFGPIGVVSHTSQLQIIEHLDAIIYYRKVAIQVILRSMTAHLGVDGLMKCSNEVHDYYYERVV